MRHGGKRTAHGAASVTCARGWGAADAAPHPRPVAAAACLWYVWAHPESLEEAARMAVGLMDIKGQYTELQERIETAVLDVLRSGRVILGPNVKAFEEEASAFIGTAGAVGVANGTDGLTIALRALDVGPGDEVITTPFTFYATAEAIVQAGARPVFVDILPDTLNIDPARIEAAITPRTKAIMPVDLFGLPADADAVAAIAAKHGLAVVEDACQAWGATYRGRRAGALGDLAVFSFFPTKNLGGFGDGGLVTAGQAALADKVRMLRFHGSKDKKSFELIGFNSRLDEVQAAILRVELEVIDVWNARRARVAAWYDEHLPREVLRPAVPPESTHVYHLYVARSPKRDRIAAALKQRAIDCAAYYTTPLHLQPVFADYGHKLGDFPVTDTAAAQNIALPMHPNLSEAAVEEVAAGVAAGLA
jgi:dTDP-4-amino-4,6-dideoxygalactose transaminase